MNLWKRLSCTVGSLLILGACAPAEKSPQAAPSSTTSAKVGWELAWEKTVAAAEQEGRVVISGPTRESWRNVLLTFEKDFPEIKVEYTGANSRDFWPRVFRERELDQHLWICASAVRTRRFTRPNIRGYWTPCGPCFCRPRLWTKTPGSAVWTARFLTRKRSTFLAL